MKNYFNLNEKTANAFKFETLPETASSSSCREAHSAVKRFLKSAEMLDESAFLGICFDKSGFHIFSDFESAISIDDFSWMFNGLFEISKATDRSSDPFCLSGRRLYALTPCTEADNNSSLSYENVFFDLIGLIDETDTSIIFIISGNKCIVLLSLPEALPLRLRTVLSLAFYGSAVREIFESAINADVYSLNSANIAEILSELFSAYINKKHTDEFSKALDCINNPPTDSRDADIPIEKLELSVRSFNCLKRAGINFVSSIQKMSDEELGSVRNLGKRGLEEIRQKVAHYMKSEKEMSSDADITDIESLIGLENVKKQIDKIRALARMKKAMPDNGKALSVSLNSAFIGNPGTAKTTVARILANILFDEGLISSPVPVEVGRADLVGEYIGQTARIVESIFRKAEGRLLFIDEAYSLVERERGSYGDEAINTIIQEMENRRQSTIVVFAGYPKEMEKLFSRNPGLKSRVSFTIEFNDYSIKELVEIAKIQAEKTGFEISEEALPKIEEICRKAKSHSDFGNGRFVRNLIEGAILSFAQRTFGGDGDSIQRFILTADDFSDDIKAEKKNPIGF